MLYSTVRVFIYSLFVPLFFSSVVGSLVEVTYCPSCCSLPLLLLWVSQMSLLHKNDILKEYRRQHREEAAAQQAANNGAADGNNTRNSVHDDEFPDLADFQVLSSNVCASPSCARPLSQASSSVTLTVGRGDTVAEAAGTAGRTSRMREKGNKAGDTNERLWPSSLSIRTSLPESRKNGTTTMREEGESPTSRDTFAVNSVKVVQDGGDVGSSKQNASNGGRGVLGADGGNSRNQHDDNDLDDDAADEFADAYYSIPPLVPSNNRDGPDGGPFAPATANGTNTAAQGVAMTRTRSDLTCEEERATKDSHLHSPNTDPVVSPTTVTTGLETFLSATDAADGPSQKENHHHRNHHNSASVGESRSINSTSRLPLSPASSQPHSPANTFASPHLQVRMGQLSAAQNTPDSGGDVDNGSVAGHGGKTVVDVSSSSVSEGPSETNRKNKSADGRPSFMSEEAVDKLGLNVTNNSLEGGTPMTRRSPGGPQADASDTMLQPPTSIVSELSMDTTTATLASLRTRSQALKAAERRSNGGRQQLQLQASSKRSNSAGGGADGDDDFSPVSATECVEGSGSLLNSGPSIVDTRVAMSPLHQLSFTGTMRTFPRIGEDEDIDVDPNSTFTDAASHSPLAMLPITFYDAYMDLIKDMKRAGGTAGRDQVNSSATAAAAKPSPKTNAKSTAAAAGALRPAPAQKQRRKSGLAALFGCCSPNESDVQTRQPPSYAHPSANLDQIDLNGSIEQRFVLPAAPNSSGSSAEESLQVVRFLKSCPLSLQNVTHRRMLYTIFNILTGRVQWPHLQQKNVSPTTSTRPLSTRSVRWEMIGFQGSNPATDVRATGVLGVLQVLYLMDYYPALAKRLWELCQNPSGAKAKAAAPSSGDGDVEKQDASSPTRMSDGVPNELPFVLICFNLTALVLDAAGQHLLDGDIAKAQRSHLTSVVPLATADKPETQLARAPGMYVCCEAFIGALELFGEVWCRRQVHELHSAAKPPLPPSHRPTVAAFGEVKADIRAQVLKKNGAALLQSAVEKVRGESLFGFV